MRFQIGTVVFRLKALGIRALAITGFLVIGSSIASANACTTLNARYAGAAAQLRQIEGQARAIRAAAGAVCESGWREGSFFDPCRRQQSRMAGHRQSVERAVQAVASRQAAIRAQLASYGCLQPTRRAVRQTRQSVPAQQPRKPAATAMLYCVRPSDGYFFPAPNAQFVGIEAAEETRDRCRFICEDAAMDVYVLEDVTAGSEAMVSVAERKPYTALSTAFVYREKQGAPRCDMQRYHARVDEARARAVTPATAGDVTVPLPTARPQVAQADLMMAFRGTIADYEAPPAPVRMVGIPYLPD